MVQGVIDRGYYNVSNDEILEAYIKVFGSAPCSHCGGIDWMGVYKKVREKFLSLESKQNNMKNLGKYIWNPIHKDKQVILSGTFITHESADQKVMEVLYNDPMRKGLIILNEKAEVKAVEVIEAPVIEIEVDEAPKVNGEKNKAIKLLDSGLNKNQVAKKLGISYYELGKLLND